MDRNLHSHLFQPSTCLGSEELKAYVKGNLPPEGRRRVENHLLDCPLCSDAVDGMENTGLTSLETLESFSVFQKKITSSEGAKIRQLLPVHLLTRVAAAAAILLIGAVAYLNWFRPVDNEALFARYYTPYNIDVPLNQRSVEGVESLQPALKTALENYSKGNFAASIPFFEEALAAETDSGAANFFAGMACLETGQLDKAIPFFENAQKSSGSYATKAAWYLSLAFLKSDKDKQAKVLLQQLLASGSYKEQEIRQLLKRL